MSAAFGRWLEELTWPEAAAWFERDPVIVVPIGAASKEHGGHLPLGTDYILARGICDRVLAALPVLAAPVVSFGYYPAFRRYPGSQHISPDTFSALLRDVLMGFVEQDRTRLLILNTGVSTEPIVNVLVRELYAETELRICAAHISKLGRSAGKVMEQRSGGHADEHETSILQVLAPHLVQLDKAVQDYGSSDGPRTVFYRPTILDPDATSGPDLSISGARGDPTLATPEKGEAALAAAVVDVVDGIRAIWPEAVAP